MRYVLVIVLIAVAVWVAWGRPISGPPEAVVTRFLRAAHGGDWGTAQSYMSQHMRGRIGQEGFGGMQRFAKARLEPFTTYDIARVTPRGDEVDVVVRLLLMIPAGASLPRAQEVAAHEYPGRMEGNQFVHAHRFQLQREGRAWRIYQFEEVDERI